MNTQQLRTLLIGETVKWFKDKRLCTGIVRDDLDQYIIVLCINVDGQELCKKVKIKRDILITKDKETMDVRRKLLENKFKKFTKIQLLDTVEKGGLSDTELEVITEVLVSKGITPEEIDAYGLQAEQPKETEQSEDDEAEEVVTDVTVDTIEKKVKKEEKVMYEDPLTEEEIELQNKRDKTKKVTKEVKEPKKQKSKKEKVVVEGGHKTLEHATSNEEIKVGKEVEFDMNGKKQKGVITRVFLCHVSNKEKVRIKFGNKVAFKLVDKLTF